MAEDREVTVARGRKAQELLDNKLLSDAFTALEDAYISAWRTTGIDNVSGREKLHVAVNVVGKVREHLQKVAADGKLSAQELHEFAEQAARKRRFGIM